MTAGNVLTRLGSAHRSPKSAVQRSYQQVQMREFGDRSKKTGGVEMTFHSQARPASAGPTISKASMVYSTINKDLKIELKKHVPLYKHREMGHILYKETESRIVRPKTALNSYKGLIKQPVIKHLNLHTSDLPSTPGSTFRGRKRQTSTGAKLHIKPEHFLRTLVPQQGGNASIMGVDWERDDRLNDFLPNFLNCKKVQASETPFLYKRGGPEAAKPLKVKPTAAQEALSQSNKRAHNRHTKFTVLDAARRENFASVYRSERVLFEHDSNFVTLARVYN